MRLKIEPIPLIFCALRAIFTHRNAQFLAAILLAGWVWHDSSAQALEILRFVAGLAVVVALAYPMRRALAKSARGDELMEGVRGGSIAAGLAMLGLRVLEAALVFSITAALYLGHAWGADALPPGAVQYLPVLQAQIDAKWPDLSMRSVLGAQIQQESGWRANATLHTAREDGAGLAQFTRAYDAQGRIRFDAVAEAAKLDPELRGWSWADRYNVRMQLMAAVIENRNNYRALKRAGVSSDYDALAMADAAHNQGLGGVMARRRLCAQMAGCDSGTWFGHVEQHSTQSTARWRGYGLSAKDITDQHVRHVMIDYRPKYVLAMGG